MRVMSVGSVAAKGRRAGKSPWVEGLGRVGLAAKGVLYFVIGLLAIQVARGGGGEKADTQGALSEIAQKPFGRGLLVVLALGLAAHALWRLAQAILDRDDEGEDAKGITKRLGSLARGVWYGVLCWLTTTRIFGESGSSGGGKSEDKATGGVLDLPGGRYLVFAAAAGFLGAALFNAYRAVTCNFEKKLETYKMGKAERTASTAVGILGHLARFVVWSLVAAFLAKAAWEYDPKEAVGLDAALHKVAGQPYGEFLLLAVALGLIAYSLYCFVQARYRDV
jgi:hypothetical protein